MAALDFPASPSTNDIHTENGASWKWNGSAWTRLGDVGAQGSQGAQGHQGVQGAGTGQVDKIYSGLTTVQASTYNIVNTVAGTGIATVQPSGMSVAGVVTATSFSGSGADLTGITAGYWGQDSVGLNTVTSVGVNTATVNDKDLQGIGNTFNGMYISNGMMIYDNALSGNHYIGTAFNGLMAGPVTIHGTLSVDGQYVVV